MLNESQNLFIKKISFTRCFLTWFYVKEIVY